MPSYISCRICGKRCRGFKNFRCKKCHIKYYRHSEETKIKIGIANKGHPVSDSTRKAVAESNKRIFRNWKGGIIHKGNYVLILMPTHPKADKLGYIREHRFIMEKKIGRFLHSWEVVHHINGIKNDNHPDNLILMIRKEHMKLHRGNHV